MYKIFHQKQNKKVILQNQLLNIQPQNKIKYYL